MAIQLPAPKVILLGGNHVMQTGWKRMSKLPAVHDRAMHNQRIHARTQRRAGLQLCCPRSFRFGQHALGTRTKLAPGSRHYWHAGKRAATPWRQASLPARQRGFQPRDPFAGVRVSGCAPLLKGTGKIESCHPGDRRSDYFSTGRYSNQSKSAGRALFCPLPVAYRPTNTPVNPPTFSEDKSRVNAGPSFFAGPFAGEQENS